MSTLLMLRLLLDQLVQDVRFAFRTMTRNKTMTFVATSTLALAIGANTAIYSFMDALLLRALPVPSPESLVVVKWHAKPVGFSSRTRGRDGSSFVLHSIDGQVYDEGGGSTSRIFPYPAYERLEAVAAPLMSSFFAYHPTGRLNVVAPGGADVAQGEYVSGRYFEGLGVVPAAGRPIQIDDDRTGAPPVAVLSMAYARRHFADVHAAVGRAVRINNAPVMVIGVMPAEFFGVDPNAAPDVYLPLHAVEISLDPNYYWLEMMGRLRPGVTAAQAQAVFGPVFDQWVATTATTTREKLNLPQVRLDPGAGGLDTLRRRYSQPLFVLMAMVGLILAIACANIANLLLARAAARQREMAVRLSVGAGRWRILRQLLTESVCLACISGALAMPVAFVSMSVLAGLTSNGRDAVAITAELNWHVLLVALALSIGCGLLFGVAPALQSSRPSVMPALKDGGQGRLFGASRPRAYRISLTQMLVVSQIAMSLLLLVAAGLFVRTLTNLRSIDLGFNPAQVLLFDVNARQAGHPPNEIAAFYDDLRQRLAAVPGVTGVTMSHASLLRAGRSLAISVDGSPADGARVLDIGSEFFSTLAIPIVQGRPIDSRDVPGRPVVAVVSEQFARTFFREPAVVGRHLRLDVPVNGAIGAGVATQPVDIEIVGVAAAAQYGELREQTPPVVYLPYGQITFPPIASMTYAVRTAGDPLDVMPVVRGVVRKADPQLPITTVRTQSVEIDRILNQEILFARLCTAFALLALTIACVGLYGTTAYSVARRTKEIGIRVALGARSGRVLWMVLRQVCTLATIGLVISIPIAVIASRLVQVFLFDVKPNDPVTVAGAALVLLIAAIAAGYGPAYRAAHINPLTAIRTD